MISFLQLQVARYLILIQVIDCAGHRPSGCVGQRKAFGHDEDSKQAQMSV